MEKKLGYLLSGNIIKRLDKIYKMLNRIKLLSIIFWSITIHSFGQNTHVVWMDELNVNFHSEALRSVSLKKNYSGDSMKIADIYYERGVGTQSINILSFFLDGHAKKFSAMVGADNKGNKKIPVKFYVIADRKILFESGEMKVGDSPKKVEADLTGIKRLGLLIVDDIGGPYNKTTYANWANAQFLMIGDYIPQPNPNDDEKYILTPAPPKIPIINSAKIFGATPGNPFLYTVAATGEMPLQFESKNLPKGLILDHQTGIISGTVKQKGIYSVTLIAKNKFGKSTKELKIKIGDTIALTPPMGWNNTNSWGGNIDRNKVMATVKAFVDKGLVNYGWSYINIDDNWEGMRGGKFNAFQPNEKYPHFQEMIDSIHSLGLKFGLYSTPWIATYGGFPGGSSDHAKGNEPLDSLLNNKRLFHRFGKYQFETNDAMQMAAWGVDYLKYDWHLDVPNTQRMHDALQKCGRDIVYSLSNTATFENAKDWARLSNLYRTGPDIRDNWASLFIGAFSLDRWAEFAGPGHWNDPDMMIIGNVSTGNKLHATRLTPDEQYSHISLYALLPAPLLIGCPVEQMDAFTLSLVENNEVIDINQDPLGKAGRLILNDSDVQVWMKPLEDGSFAVGLFNIDGYGKTPQSYFRWGDETSGAYTFDLIKAGLNGKWKIRDVWRQKNIGEFTNSFSTNIRHHGVMLLRLFPIK